MAKSSKVLSTKSGSDEYVLEKFFDDYIVPWFQERVINLVTYEKARKEIELLKQKSAKLKKVSLENTDEEKPSVQRLPDKPSNASPRKSYYRPVSASQTPNEPRKQASAEAEVELQRLLLVNANYKKKLSEMKEEMCEIKAQADIDLRKKDQHLEKLRTALENAKAQVDELTMASSETEADLKNLLFENANYKKKLSEMEEEMCEIKSRADIDLRKKDQHLEKLRTALENAKAQVDELKWLRERSEISALSGPKSPFGFGTFSEIYDCEWTEAFENIPLKNEERKIGVLHGIIQGSFAFCQQMIKRQNQKLETVILAKSKVEQNRKSASTDVQFIQAMNDLRMKLSTDTAKNIAEDFTTNVVQIILSGFGINHQKMNEALKKYAFKCAEICWLVLIHYPQVSLSDDKVDEPFDQEIYVPYTKSVSEFDQPTVEFCAWPALCQGSNVLVKGVAQPKGVMRRKPLDLQR